MRESERGEGIRERRREGRAEERNCPATTFFTDN